MSNSIDEINAEKVKHLDDPVWLSKAQVMLSGYLFELFAQTAKAELEEKEAVMTHLKDASEAGTKTSVAEAEKLAVVKTQNKYGNLKLKGEATVQLINSIKINLKRLELEATQLKEG